MLNSKCKTCKYGTPVFSGSGYSFCCYYIVVTGHRRPCLSGEACQVYEKGARITKYAAS